MFFLKKIFKKGQKQLQQKQNAYTEDHKEHLKTKTISASLVEDIFTKYYTPESVIDLGCGVGAWLKCWKERGAKKIKGLDLYASDNVDLLIDKDEFEVINLNNFVLPDNSEKYDLAMSLEVAEHLEPEMSEKFVKVLSSLSDCVLFSAAIPLQPGTEHINCKPIQFWVDLFNKEGFDCFDVIRNDACKDKNIEWWYSQNILVFAKNEKRELFLNAGAKIDNKPLFFYQPQHVKMLIEQYVQNPCVELDFGGGGNLLPTLYDKFRKHEFCNLILIT